MAMERRVVLYGDTVVLAGMEESLRKYSRLEVISLNTSWELAERNLGALHPAAVILDLGVVTREFAFDLLRFHPDLLLIGLDPGGNRLMVLFGEQSRSLTTTDLVRLIDRGGDEAVTESIDE